MAVMVPNWAALVELKESCAWCENRATVDGVVVLADKSPLVDLAALAGLELRALTGCELRGIALDGVCVGNSGAAGMPLVCNRGS